MPACASHPMSAVLNEAYIHACVEDAGVPVPKLLGVMPSENGGWSISMEYVSGKTLDELMDEHPDKIDEYMEKLEGFINRCTARVLQANNQNSLRPHFDIAAQYYKK